MLTGLFTTQNGIEVPKKFDAVVANPPYSQNWDIKNIDREKRCTFQRIRCSPASKADYAFVLHGLHHLDEKGTMAIVLPHGVLFRGASEGKSVRIFEEIIRCGNWLTSELILWYKYSNSGFSIQRS